MRLIPTLFSLTLVLGILSMTQAHAGGDSSGGLPISPVSQPLLEKVSHSGNIAPPTQTICRIFPNGKLDIIVNGAYLESRNVVYTANISNKEEMEDALEHAANGNLIAGKPTVPDVGFAEYSGNLNVTVTFTLYQHVELKKTGLGAVINDADSVSGLIELMDLNCKK